MVEFLTKIAPFILPFILAYKMGESFSSKFCWFGLFLVTFGWPLGFLTIMYISNNNILVDMYDQYQQQPDIYVLLFSGTIFYMIIMGICFAMGHKNR